MRVVCENDGFVALVPFWAVWPFEILICGRRHFGSMNEFTADEIASSQRHSATRHFHL